MDESRTYYFCLKKVNNISVTQTGSQYKQSNGRESYILLLFKKSK